MVSAQTTVTFQPGAAEGKDAEIFSLEASSNYGTNDLLRGNAWTFQGDAGVVRGLIEFNFLSIPAGSTIHSAMLSLYAPNAPHSQLHSGNNEAYIQRINSYWNEMEVNWNNQPSTTTLHQVYIPETNSGYQNLENVDVTTLVQYMFEDPSNSFGFMIALNNEDPLRRMTYVSSDYVDQIKHPKLVIQYTPPPCITLVLQPGSTGKDVEIFSLDPFSNNDFDILRGNAWTFSGNTGIQRSLLEFDLVGIPSDAIVTHAYLTLYPTGTQVSQLNSGSNTAKIQRITSEWEESTVSWNSQPSYTSNHSIVLPASTIEFQEYRSMDVTLMVQDMVADPANSFGFMLGLQTEEPLRRLTFASSDDTNPLLHPRLEICYTEFVGVKPVPGLDVHLNVLPNPTQDWVEIDAPVDGNQYDLQVINLTGAVLVEEKVQAGSIINMEELPSALYLFRFNELKTGKVSFIKVVKQ
jgi:hypothetical protein